MLFIEVTGLARLNVNHADDAVLHDQGNGQLGAHSFEHANVPALLRSVVHQHRLALLRREASHAFTDLDADTFRRLRRMADGEAHAQLLGFFIEQHDAEDFVVNHPPHQLCRAFEQGIEVERGVDHLGHFHQEAFHIERRCTRDAGRVYWTRGSAQKLAPSSCMICRPELVPTRLAPAFTMAARPSAVRMPPEAFTPARLPTTPRIRATSSTVAPAPFKPVEVFTKSAPAATASSQARIFSSTVSRQVSSITLRIAPAPCATSATARISFSTSMRSLAFNAAMLMTMSSSCVPSSTRSAASARFVLVRFAPRGKPTVDPTLTALERNREATMAT